MYKFRKACDREKRFITEKLFPMFSEYVKQTMNDMREDITAKKWLPEKTIVNPVVRVTRRKSFLAASWISQQRSL